MSHITTVGKTKEEKLLELAPVENAQNIFLIYYYNDNPTLT